MSNPVPQPVLDMLLDATVAKVASLALRNPRDDSLIDVVKRKVPQRADGYDGPAMITVCLSDTPVEQIHAHMPTETSSGVWYRYTIYVTLIAPSDQDNYSYIAYYVALNNQIAEAFTPRPYPYNEWSSASNPVLGVTGVFDLRVRRMTLFHRGKLMQNYDYQQTGLEFLSDRQ